MRMTLAMMVKMLMMVMMMTMMTVIESRSQICERNFGWEK